MCTTSEFIHSHIRLYVTFLNYWDTFTFTFA